MKQCEKVMVPRTSVGQMLEIRSTLSVLPPQTLVQKSVCDVLILYHVPHDRKRLYIVYMETGCGTSQLDDGFWMAKDHAGYTDSALPR